MAEEKKLEQKFVKMTESRGWKALKLSCPGFAGMPDRIILRDDGEVFFAELKANGKKPEPIQTTRMCMLRKMGFRVYVVDSGDAAISVLNEEAAREARG